jgi:hypothetical protein
MVKASLDDNNLSKMHQLYKIGTDRTCGRTSAYVTKEDIRIVLYDEFPLLRTTTGQGNIKTNTGWIP